MVFTRNTLKDMSDKYKMIAVDIPARDAVNATNKRMTKRVRYYSLQGVDSGKTTEFDLRDDPRCADHPGGGDRT